MGRRSKSVQKDAEKSVCVLKWCVLSSGDAMSKSARHWDVKCTADVH